ncbi:UNVERIFIED_CONTAM: hypothetical protein RMT77_013612 [Armadillidium vulgare]
MMLKLRVLFFICLFFFKSESQEFGTSACPSEFVLIDIKCYSFQQRAVPWLEAKSSCESDGAELASVKTLEQYNDILQHINNNYPGKYWLSGALTNGEWVWTTDGSPMNKEWFGRLPHESGNLCAYFCSITKKYWSGSCRLSKKFICERDLQLTVNAEVDTSNRDQSRIDPRIGRLLYY